MRPRHQQRTAKGYTRARRADDALGPSSEGLQVHKNLGTSFGRLGDQDAAVEHYGEALRLDPNLAEAHNAPGYHFTRIGKYREALAHFDQVVFADRNEGRMTAVVGWRANVQFNLGEGAAAFREINSLLGQADRERWVWPWCMRLVASFGRTSIDNALLARVFWQRYVQARPEDSHGWWELLMASIYLRGQGHDLGKPAAPDCSNGHFRRPPHWGREPPEAQVPKHTCRSCGRRFGAPERRVPGRTPMSVDGAKLTDWLEDRTGESVFGRDDFRRNQAGSISVWGKSSPL